LRYDAVSSRARGCVLRHSDVIESGHDAIRLEDGQFVLHALLCEYSAKTAGKLTSIKANEAA